MEEKAILFQAVVPTGERRSLMNAWFKIQPTLKITGPFQGRQLPFRLGISSTLVESSLYTIGGRVPNHFVLSDCISWLDTRDAFNVWETSELQSPCFDSVLGVYRQFLCIFPGVWKHGYYHMHENEYLTKRKGYVWNTKDKENNCNKTGIIEPPPTGQWHRIRACAALDKGGLLIAMDGEKNNFFLYNPEANNWKICDFNHPLPKFFGETSFAASNGRLYILELRGMSSAFLYIYNIKEREGEVEGELVINKKPIREFDDYLWLMDKRDRVVRLVPVGNDKLCFLWLGPVSYENENGWPPVRTLHYLKFMVSISPNPAVDFLDSRVFPTNITDLLDCLPCDPKLFGAEEVVMDPATTMAAGENAILFQAVVPSGERKLPMNAWFKIQPNDHILGPFHGRQPFRVGISSTFVGSSLYTIGGEVPSSRLPRPCDISWLDTRNPFNGWEIGELPCPCVNSVICFHGYSLYILTPTEGYIWNTKDNCLKTRICLPKVDVGDQKQRLRIRACAALDERGLLIAMDGENSTDFYLHPEPENEARDWERFGTPLPRLTNEISFAASKGRLYILDFPNNPPASLYIYDTKVENLIRNHKMDLPTLNALWNQDEKDRVVRLAPVADDMLCFLWLGPFENKNGRPPVKTLHYLKLKFPFNPNDELFDTVESKSFPTNVTKLLDCLPCGPEQFRAEVEGKSPPHHQPDAFPNQWEDRASAEALGAREEGWKETQATKWNKLKSGATTAAEVFNEAYKPPPLEIYTKTNDSDEGWKPVTEEIVANPQLLFKTKDSGWQKGIEVFNGANPSQRLWTNELRRYGSNHYWREGWKEADEIQNEAYRTGPPEFYTDHGWMTITKIVEADQQPKLCIWYQDDKLHWKQATDITRDEQPPSLYMRKGGLIGGRIEAFEVDRPRKFIKPENWPEKWEEVREKLKDSWIC